MCTMKKNMGVRDTTGDHFWLGFVWPICLRGWAAACRWCGFVRWACWQSGGPQEVVIGELLWASKKRQEQIHKNHPPWVHEPLCICIFFGWKWIAISGQSQVGSCIEVRGWEQGGLLVACLIRWPSNKHGFATVLYNVLAFEKTRHFFSGFFEAMHFSTKNLLIFWVRKTSFLGNGPTLGLAELHGMIFVVFLWTNWVIFRWKTHGTVDDTTFGWKASRCWAARECGRHDCTSAGLLFSWVLILGWVLSAGNPNILSEKKPDEPCTQEHSLPTYEISLYSTHSLNTYESSSIWSLQSHWKWGWFEVNSNGFFFGFQEFCECQWCPSCFESTKIWSYEFLIFSNDRTETGFSWEFRSWASWWFQFLYYFHRYIVG